MDADEPKTGAWITLGSAQRIHCLSRPGSSRTLCGVSVAGVFYTVRGPRPDACKICLRRATKRTGVTPMSKAERLLWEWHVRHYGEGVNVPGTYRKLVEEVGELGEALIRDVSADAGREEIGDVAALCLILARGLGFNSVSGELLQRVVEKLHQREQGESR